MVISEKTSFLTQPISQCIKNIPVKIEGQGN